MEINRFALRALRLQDRTSVSALARAVGVQQSHLSNIEAGRRQASDPVIVALAEALAVPVAAIVLGHVEQPGAAYELEGA